MSLADKIRRARESSFQLGDVTIRIRRPTDLQAMGMHYATLEDGVAGVSKFVIDWSGVNEVDLIPGGNPTPVPFDPEDFVEWISDKPEHWKPLINGVLQAYKLHRKELDAELKN